MIPHLPGLVNQLARIPFQENERWIFFIPQFPHITLYVSACSVPMYQFENDPITKAATHFQDIGKVTIEFREDSIGTVQSFLNTLEGQIWDRQTRVFRDNQDATRYTAVLILDDLSIGAQTIAYRF